MKTVRPFSGNAGHAIVKSHPSASIRASVTGPMFPAGVESKVEQVLEVDLPGAALPQVRERTQRLSDGFSGWESSVS